MLIRCIFYLSSSWNLKFADTHLKRTNPVSVFPGYSCYEPEPIQKPIVSEFRIDHLTWHSIGTMILNFYEKHHDNMSAICCNYVLEDFYGTQEVDADAELDTVTVATVENGHQKSPDSLVDDGDAPAAMNCDDVCVVQSTDNSSNSNCDVKFVEPKSGDIRSSAEQSGADDSEASTKPIASDAAAATAAETSKPKPVRRRCSDLSFLEQWGWHKHRRYNRKKSIDRNEPDKSLNGILRRILAKYFK